MIAILHIAPKQEVEVCAYCDEPFGPIHYGESATKDHIVPRVFALSSNGPAAGRGNIVMVCGRCNGLKGAMLPSAIRATAAEHRKRANLLDKIAARVDALIEERRLLP